MSIKNKLLQSPDFLKTYEVCTISFLPLIWYKCAIGIKANSITQTNGLPSPRIIRICCSFGSEMKMIFMKNLWSVLLFAFVTLETYCQVARPKELDIQTASILYFISGLFIAVLPLIKIKPNPFEGENKRILRELNLLLFLLFLIFLIPPALERATALFQRFAVDYKVADMLPVLKIMVERWLKGERIYELIPFWEGTEPIYLPAMWLPYIPTIFLGFDMRWTSMLAFLVGISLIFFMGKKGSFNFKFLLIGLPLYLLIHGILYKNSVILYLSEEPLVIAYYLFLAYALAKNKPYLIGVALSLCLMSRFALAFWFLMYLGYLFIFKNKKTALKIGATTGGICLVLLFATEAFWQLDVILNLPNIYLNHLLENEWKFNGFATTNLGLIKFFSFEAIPLVNRLFFLFNLFIPISCLLFYWLFKDKINQSFFAICSLKLSLVFFYNFLIMPFSYLFYTSTFLSIAILSWYLKEDFTG